MSESKRWNGKRPGPDKGNKNPGLLKDSMWADQQRDINYEKKSTSRTRRSSRSQTQISSNGFTHSKSSGDGGGEKPRNRRNRSEPSLQQFAMESTIRATSPSNTRCDSVSTSRIGIKQLNYDKEKTHTAKPPSRIQVEKIGLALPYVRDSIPPVIHKALDRILPSLSSDTLAITAREGDLLHRRDLTESLVDYSVYGVPASGTLSWTFLLESAHIQTGFEYDEGQIVTSDELQLATTKGSDDEELNSFDTVHVLKDTFPDGDQLYRSLFAR